MALAGGTKRKCRPVGARPCLVASPSIAGGAVTIAPLLGSRCAAPQVSARFVPQVDCGLCRQDRPIWCSDNGIPPGIEVLAAVPTAFRHSDKPAALFARGEHHGLDVLGLEPDVLRQVDVDRAAGQLLCAQARVPGDRRQPGPGQ